MKKSINITFSALLTAFICILSQTCLPTPTVPITLQIFAIGFCGFLLSVKWSIVCVVTYIFIGALGLPVFSSFQGGFQVLTGPTGGFIIGFIPLVISCGITAKCKLKFLKILIGTLGLILCHIFGIIQYCIITGLTFSAAVLTASLPFLPKDLILLFSAFFVSDFVSKRISDIKV